jgi:MFS family permease
LTSTLGWEWNFFVNVPVGALAVACVPALLSESRDRTAPRLDLLGAATVTGGLGLLVYGLDVATDAGFASPRALGVLGLALALIMGFCGVEGRVRNPLVPFRIFCSRTLAGADLVTLVLSAVIGAQGFFCTLYMQQILGYSPLVTGLAFLPLTVTVMVAAGVGSTLASRGGAKVTMVLGMALLAIGMVLLARISSEGGYLGVLLPGFFFTALGLGFTFVTATIAGTSGVADGEQGLASGLINTAQQVGTALGLAILVTAATARTGALSGGDVPSAGDLVEGYRMAFWLGGGLAALGACIALFVVRRDECEEAASKLEDPEDAAAFLAECRQASRM